MNVQRVAWISIGVAVLAAMIAGATTSGSRRIPLEAPSVNTTAIELQGAELAAEVARLRARLRPTEEPQQPARNLFQFANRTAAPSADLLREASSPAGAPPAAPAPSFILVGFAVESAVDGPERTAIVSAFGDVFLVKDGDTLASQYRIVRVEADAVEMTSLHRRHDAHPSPPGLVDPKTHHQNERRESASPIPTPPWLPSSSIRSPVDRVAANRRTVQSSPARWSHHSMNKSGWRCRNAAVTCVSWRRQPSPAVPGSSSCGAVMAR